MASYDNDLLIGIAQLLAANDHGTWRTNGVYTDSETAIVLDVIPQAPDNAITLSAYGVSDDPSLADNVTGLQIRTRAGGRDSRVCRQIGADIFTELHGRTQLTLATGLRVVQILRRSFVSGGQDTNGRWSMIQNFYCDLYVPAMHAFQED